MSIAEYERAAIDPSAGLELVTGDEIALELTRHVFLAGDLLDPNRRREIGLQYGGEEVPNRCLRRTNGLIPRCQIVPMEFWGEPLPLELFPDGVRPYKLKGQPTEAVNLSSGFNPRLVDKPLFFMPLFPGELIRDTTGDTNGEHRGVVEINILRGIEHGSVDREFEALYFPEGYVPPIALREVRQHIETVMNSVADPDARSVGEDMLLSCDEFREYVEAVVSKANTQLDERVRFQHTYALTPKLRHFMAQLELQPRASAIQGAQERVAAAAAQSGLSGEALEQILNRVLQSIQHQPAEQPAE